MLPPSPALEFTGGGAIVLSHCALLFGMSPSFPRMEGSPHQPFQEPFPSETVPETGYSKDVYLPHVPCNKGPVQCGSFALEFPKSPAEKLGYTALISAPPPPISPVNRRSGPGGRGHAAQLHGAGSDHLGDP